MSERISPQKLLQVSSQNFCNEEKEFLLKSTMIWFVLSSFCWKRLLSEWAGGERGCSSCQQCALEKGRSQREQGLDLDPTPASRQAGLQQCWRRAGFRAGAGFSNSALTGGSGWVYIAPLWVPAGGVGGSAQARCAQPVMLWLLYGPGKATWVLGQAFRCVFLDS